MNEVFEYKYRGKRSDSKTQTKIGTTWPLSQEIYSPPGKIPIIVIIIIVTPSVCSVVKLINSSDIQGLCSHKVPLRRL